MKYIKTNEPVTLKNLQDESLTDEKGNVLTITIQDFILQRLSDVKFSSDMDGVLSAVQIKQAIDESKNQSFIALETKDWEKLSAIVKNPSNPYNPSVAVSLLELMKSVTEASNEKPCDGFVKTGEQK